MDDSVLYMLSETLTSICNSTSASIYQRHILAVSGHQHLDVSTGTRLNGHCNSVSPVGTWSHARHCECDKAN